MRRRRSDNPLSLFSFQDIITSVTGILILLAIMLAIAVIRQKDSAPVTASDAKTEELRVHVASLQHEIDQLSRIIQNTEAQLSAWSSHNIDELRVEQETMQAIESDAEREQDALKRLLSQAQQDLKNAEADPMKASLEESIQRSKQNMQELNEELERLKSGARIVYNFRNARSQPWLVEVSSTEIRVGRAEQKGPPKSLNAVAKLASFVDELPDSDRYLVIVVKPSGVHNYHGIRDELNLKDVEIGVELIGEDQFIFEGQSEEPK